MRFVIGELRTETDSFSPVLSTMEFWGKAGIYEGQDVRDHLEGKASAVAGFMAALDEYPEPHETICGMTMSCQSGGPTEQSVMDYFLDHFLTTIRQNLPLDGVFISLHGAMQSTVYDDVEGEVLERIRSVVGEKCIIAASTDLHAYVSEKMVKYANIITAYHTYPHVDFFDTGYRAAKLGLACLSEGKKPQMACVKVPICVSASSYDTLGGSMKDLMEYCKGLIADGKVLDYGVYPVTPWLDVNGCYSTVTAIAEDKETAEAYAKDIAERFYAIRHNFVCNFYSVDEVIEIAENNKAGGPVILQDSSDSPGAGAAGDSMAAIARMIELGKTGIKTAIVLNDPYAADKAHELGVGAKAVFKLGASRDPNSVSVEVEGYVRSLHDGEYIQEGPAGKGNVNRIGNAAVIRFDNIDVVVCHWMAGCSDPQLFRAFGIEPTLYQILVIKACTSYRVAYKQFTDQFLETNTPGSATSDLNQLPYKKYAKNGYPWVDAEFTPTEFMYHEN